MCINGDTFIDEQGLATLFRPKRKVKVGVFEKIQLLLDHTQIRNTK